MIDNFTGCGSPGCHLWPLKICRVQALLAFRISTEKSELGLLGRWSSQGVKMWCEEGLLQSGCYKTNSKSEETVMEDGKNSQDCLPVFQPGWPLGGSW